MASRVSNPGLRKRKPQSEQDWQDVLAELNRNNLAAVTVQDEAGQQRGFRANFNTGALEVRKGNAWHPFSTMGRIDRVTTKISSTGGGGGGGETTPGITDHNLLSNLQGGQYNDQYYHLTAAQWGLLTPITVDPDADRIVFWDNSASALAYLTASTGLNITGTNLTCTITQYTDEMAQDAVGNAVGNGLDYDDGSGAISVDETELLHNSMGGKQGGTTSEYYHLTAAEYTGLHGGTVGQVAYFSETGVLAGEAGMTYDAPTDFISLVGGIKTGDGTAEAPAMRFTSEATGLYLSAAGVMTGTIAGSRKFSFSAVGLSILKGAGAAYPLDVTGQGYISTQLGVGAAPSADQAVLATHTQATNALSIGVGSNAVVTYAAGNFTSAAYGYLGGAYYRGGATASTGLGIRGIEARIGINTATGTVTSGAAILANIRSDTNGVTGTFTTAYGVYAYTSQGTGSTLTIGTLYGFYMPACTGTTRWGVYIADTAANSYFAAQVQGPAGSVGAPSFANNANIDCGWYFPANGIGGVINGTEYLTLTANLLTMTGQIKATYTSNGAIYGITSDAGTNDQQSPFFSKRLTSGIPTTNFSIGYAYLIEGTNGGGAIAETSVLSHYAVLDSATKDQAEWQLWVHPADAGTKANIFKVTHGGDVYTAGTIYGFLTDLDTYLQQATNTLSLYAGAAELFRVKAFGGGTPHNDVTILGDRLGFYGTTAVAQPTAYTQTYSTAAKTNAAVTYVAPSGGTTVDTQCRASLAQLAADHLASKKLLNALIDDLQALGLTT
jgi:hypothetical protein